MVAHSVGAKQTLSKFHKRRITREDGRKGYHSSKRTKEQTHQHQVTLFPLRERLYYFNIF